MFAQASAAMAVLRGYEAVLDQVLEERGQSPIFTSWQRKLASMLNSSPVPLQHGPGFRRGDAGARFGS